MRVLILSAGQDTGGQGFRIKKAFAKYEPTWHIDSVHSTDTFLRFPSDKKYDPKLVKDLYGAADVVHHKNGLHGYAMFDNGYKKPTVIHHQGSRLRQNAKTVPLEGRSVGARQLVSTVDLLRDCPEAQWLPSPLDIDWVRSTYLVKREKYDKKIRILHAPTNRRAKNTDHILKVIEEIAKWRKDIELDLVEGREWKVALSRKGRADIVIDQITLGYGNNAVEAFAMGIPVISGWEDPDDERLWHEITGWDTLPFLPANAITLHTQLLKLIDDEALRAEVGARGRAYAERFHSEQAVVERLKPIYENAPKSKGARYLKLAPTPNVPGVH